MQNVPFLQISSTRTFVKAIIRFLRYMLTEGNVCCTVFCHSCHWSFYQFGEKICPPWIRPCVRAFDHHGDARKQGNHILAKLCRRINQPTGFILHLKLTQKYCWDAKKITFQVVLFLVGNVGAPCTYKTSNYRPNGSSDQPFPITLSKNENDIYVQKVAFLANLKLFLKNSIPLQSYSHFPEFLPSKPPEHSHARAWRVILANARSERHFKIQFGYFGYCRIPLNTEKITILAIFFCKRKGLTRLWPHLPIWV